MWFAPQAGQMETQRFSCFRVTHRELAHLRVSVLNLTHNPISVSSQSLSDISTKLFLKTFPIYRWPFQHSSTARYLSSVFHTIYKEETSVALSSPHSLLSPLCLPHRRWKAPLGGEIWNSNQVFGFLLDDLIFPIAMVLGGFHIMAYFCQGSER